MQYEIISTEAFDKWLSGLKTNRARIIDRLLRIEVGNFGDFKKLDGCLYELRLFFGAGYRVYYTIRGNKVVLLLNGGDKSSQKKT